MARVGIIGVAGLVLVVGCVDEPDNSEIGKLGTPKEQEERDAAPDSHFVAEPSDETCANATPRDPLCPGTLSDGAECDPRPGVTCAYPENCEKPFARVPTCYCVGGPGLADGAVVGHWECPL
jgi:hypothetical protein